MTWLEWLSDGSRRLWYVVLIVAIMGVGSLVATGRALVARGI